MELNIDFSRRVAIHQLVRGKHLFGVHVVTSQFKPPKGA
jgi:hypothetical protein